MRYIIFGCGNVGKEAMCFVGADAVLCFASNYNYEGRQVCGKAVISFSEMERIYAENEDIVIIIASGNYREQLEAQVREAGLRRYFVYRDVHLGYTVNHAPKSFSCSEVVRKFDLSGYRRIGVYGEMDEIIWWAAEIRRQKPLAEIMLIPVDDHTGFESVCLPAASLEGAGAKIDCLCVAIPRWKDPMAIRDHFLSKPAPYAMIDLFDIERFEPAFHYEGMERFKNIHAGKRVFVIGNGPSLTIKDLNTLHAHGEICIGFNKVYRAYDRTPWRADYLGITDGMIIDDCEEDIPSLPGQLILADSFHFYPNKRFSNVQYYHMHVENFYPNYPGFSEDASKVMYNGWTVIYDIGLQLAAYMGFREIYLLGVDHSMNGNAGRPENHFIAEYTRPEEAEKYQGSYFHAVELARAFEKAEQYSRSHGFRIFNATRGGKLEVFERVDFDSLFTD